MKFQLLGTKLLIEADKKDVARTESGIFTTSSVEKVEDKNIGTIVQLGHECKRKIVTENGEEREFKVGDKVSYQKHQCTSFDLDGNKSLLIDEEFIIFMIYD